MIVAFDEHVPIAIVGVFRALADGRHLSGWDFRSATDFHSPTDAPNDDRPWLERFRDAGGRVVISADKRMRGNPYERDLLRQAGFVTVFLGKGWHASGGRYAQVAGIVRWWPRIMECVQSATPGSFWEAAATCGTALGEMKDCTPPTA